MDVFTKPFNSVFINFDTDLSAENADQDQLIRMQILFGVGDAFLKIIVIFKTLVIVFFN